MKEKPIYINGKKSNYTVTINGDIYSLNYGRSGKKKKLVPCGCKDKTGYLYVNLYYKKKLHRKLIHRLVAMSCLPNPENKPEVNHKDGNKKNNKATNLEWVTEKENTYHAYKTKLRKVHFGEGATDAKITKKTVKNICKMLEENEKGTREIADELGVSFAIVSNIKHKKAWLEVSKNYDISRHNHKSKPKSVKKKTDIKITEKDVIKICGLLQNSDLSVKEIEKITGVGKYKINAILYRNAWTKISNNYDFSKRRRR